MSFSRPVGDIEKGLSRLMRLPTATYIDRIRTVTNIKESTFDISDKERFNNTITEFNYFSKKVFPQLKAMKKVIENFKGLKNTALANNKVLVNMLDKYEELNMASYTQNNPDYMVIRGENKNGDLKVQIDSLLENFKNPFEEMYHWCKGEIFDLEALFDAISVKESIENKQKKLEASKKQTQQDLENVNQGRTSVRTLFNKDTSTMLSTIENVIIFFLYALLERKRIRKSLGSRRFSYYLPWRPSCPSF